MPSAGDASFDANMGPMPQDGGAQQPPMDGQDPMGEMPMDGQDPMGGGEDPMMDGGAPEGDSEIDQIFAQLSPENQDAATSYARSLLKQSSKEDEDAMGSPEDMGQIAEMYKVKDGKLEEVFNCDDDSVRNVEPSKKKKQIKGSPFNSPIK